MTPPFLSHFTPSLMSHEALEAIFVQREPLVTRLVDLSRTSALTPAKNYTLLIGPRGIGKTHLIALLYHRLTAMADLRDRLCIAWLREDEWGVTSFLELLLRIFTAVSEEYKDNALAEQVTALYDLPPQEAQRQAETLLREYCGTRTLLLLMENLDELFHEFGDTGQRQFRAYLQEHPFCTIVATAQSLFSGVSLRTSPFYGFFRIRHLEELRLDEAVQLLIRIAQYEQQATLVAFLQQPRGRARVQAIAHLAGGNHRVYVIMAQFLTHESLDELVEPFLSMLDDLTPYYQARMAWLSPQQRKMVNFLCNNSGALPVKEIAQRCFMSQQTAASQLQKLQQMGYVHSTTVGRESFYELREPLMRMGVEVKKHRGQRLFVEFLRYWYTPGELEARLELLRPHAMLDREYLHAALQTAQAPSTREYADSVVTTVSQAGEIGKSGQWGKASYASEKVTAPSSDAVQSWDNRRGALSEESRHEDAIAVYDEVIARYGQASVPALQEAVAQALVNKGYRLGVLNRSEEEIAVYDEVIARYGQASVPALQEQVVRALFNKGYRLGVLNRSEDAIAVYDEVIARYGQASVPALQEQVAQALVGKGDNLSELGYHEQALEAYNTALARDPVDSLAAIAHYSRAITLFALHRWDDALHTLDDTLTRFPQDHDQLDPTPADAVLRLLLTSTDVQMWPERITALLACYDKHGALASLGRSLVRSIATLYSPMVSRTTAQIWWDLWQECGRRYDALTIPLRLLDAAVSYSELRDQRVLLRLPMEERKVLEQIIGSQEQRPENVR